MRRDLEPPDNTKIPSCLYSCSNDGCAEERSWPAADLSWVPAWGGWYCDYCIDDRIEDDDKAVEIGITLAAWLKKRLDRRIVPQKSVYTLKRPDGSFVKIGDIFDFEECEDLFLVDPRREVIEKIYELRNEMIDDLNGCEVVHVDPNVLVGGLKPS